MIFLFRHTQDNSFVKRYGQQFIHTEFNLEFLKWKNSTK